MRKTHAVAREKVMMGEKKKKIGREKLSSPSCQDRNKRQSYQRGRDEREALVGEFDPTEDAVKTATRTREGIKGLAILRRMKKEKEWCRRGNEK